MSRRRSRRQRLPSEAFTATIDSMAHDGRGVAHLDGKAVFIDGALPGEDVRFLYVSQRRSYDEGRTVEVLRASPERVEPRCPHFGVCGGCSLQHQAPAAQIRAKQGVLLDNLERLGRVEPETVLEPLRGPSWGYRRKARLGVRYVRAKGKVLVGFRERHSSFVTDLSRCEVLHPAIGLILPELQACIGALSIFDKLAQIEVAIGDESRALVFRNLAEPTAEDRARLRAFGVDHGFDVYLQPGGPATVAPLNDGAQPLSYALPAYGVDFRFGPMDFTQVNADINRAMVEHALKLLDPRAGERIIDLFCGLGNFTLPIARERVIGVEGDQELVARARENAMRNGVGNAEFHAADLTSEFENAPWLRAGVDKALLDPPRSGALEVLPHLVKLRPLRIVYVSCNPATLARDAGELVHAYGYRLLAAGVMDMFPHTAHVESIALFER